MSSHSYTELIQLIIISYGALSRKLQLSRKRDTIYKVSNDGFSLQKAGVLSIGGSSLKWSRSIERHSKKANEVSVFGTGTFFLGASFTCNY